MIDDLVNDARPAEQPPAATRARVLRSVEMATTTELGRRIRDARKRAGLSQVEAAEAAGMVQPAWSRLEASASDSTTLGVMRRVAAAIGCSVGELVDAPAD